MGLGAKIKEALHGDHYDKDVKAPGAYPDEEPLSGHNNGNEYVAPHSDLINKKWETTGPAETSDQTHTGLSLQDELGLSSTFIMLTFLHRRRQHGCHRSWWQSAELFWIHTQQTPSRH